MKMKYSTILFLALFVQSCSKEKFKNDWTIENLKGKVKSYSEFSYKAEERFGNIEKGTRKRIFLEYDNQNKFDENGNMIESNKYYSDGRLERREIYKFDEIGNKIENNWYNSVGSLELRETYKYDKMRNMIESNWYYSNGRLGNRSTYKYDEKGNNIEINWYNPDGSLSYWKTDKYNEKGNRIESNWYTSDSSLYRRVIYDEKGNEIEKYNSDGILKSKWTFKYEFDKQGNWVKRIDFEDSIPKFLLEREYEYYE